MKKFCYGKIEKVRFVEELELYKIVQDHNFSETHKNLVKTWLFGAKMEFRDKTQPDERWIFLTSFYTFPKNVFLNNFVELELFYKTHFSDFAGTKFFSSTLTIFHFRFSTQTAEF